MSLNEISHSELLQHDNSLFASWLKSIFIKFPLAVQLLVERAFQANLKTIGKLFSNRGKNKYANMLADFLKQGRIQVDVNAIQQSSFEFIVCQLELALLYLNIALTTKQRKENLGTLNLIPDSEWALITRSIV